MTSTNANNCGVFECKKLIHGTRYFMSRFLQRVVTVRFAN